MLTGTLDKSLHLLYTSVILLYKTNDRHNQRAWTTKYVGSGTPDGGRRLQPQGSLLPLATEGGV